MEKSVASFFFLAAFDKKISFSFLRVIDKQAAETYNNKRKNISKNRL